MKKNIVVLKVFASVLFFMIWILIISLNLSGITHACTLKKQPNNFVEYTSSVKPDLSQVFTLYNCCSQSFANRFSKADYIFNLGEELNPRLSSKRFQVLPHGILENYGKSFSEKAVSVKIEPAFPKADIPIDISSLLV